MMINRQLILKKLTLSHLWNGLVAVAIIIVFFNPSAKALLIRGLMKVGLFQPDMVQPLKADHSINLPAITFEKSDGRLINLSDQKGKVVFINFWATWCPPCIAEMPSINELYEKLKGNKNIVFLMVDVDHDFGKSGPFMSKHQFSLPLYQANTNIPENVLGSAIPSTVIFDKTGKIVFRHEGGADYSNSSVLTHLIQLAK